MWKLSLEALVFSVNVLKTHPFQVFAVYSKLHLVEFISCRFCQLVFFHVGDVYLCCRYVDSFFSVI